MINMKYDKIELSYSFNSLEPYIDEETVRIHYTKHLQGYVDKINEVSLNQFGSGYGWLVKDKHDNLKIMSTLNQDSPYSFGFKPLLTIDVWEHAYYLKYKNNRKEYIENIWNLIDWAKIENIYNS